MLRDTVKAPSWTCLLSLVLFVSPLAYAGDKKKAPTSPQAPIPTQILNAKTIFLSNACEIDTDHCTSLYNDFYAGLASLGSYKLVLEPKGSDLIFEIHDASVLSSVSGFNGNVSSYKYFQSQLLIRDPLTHVILWSFSSLDKGGGPSPADVLVGQYKQFLDSKRSAQGSTTP